MTRQMHNDGHALHCTVELHTILKSTSRSYHSDLHLPACPLPYVSNRLPIPDKFVFAVCSHYQCLLIALHR